MGPRSIRIPLDYSSNRNTYPPERGPSPRWRVIADNAKVSSERARAGRRLNVALALINEGDGVGAAELARDATALAPSWADAWFVLGEAQGLAGDVGAAVSAYRNYLERDPSDLLGSLPRLALLGATETPERLPPAYVRQLFDQIAPAFETQLVHRLGYCGPRLLWQTFQSFKQKLPNNPSILDLGCGTGLAGEVFTALGGTLDGLDLSSGMLAQARAKGLYHDLHSGDLMTPPDMLCQRYDLLLAADVFNYLGDLAPVFSNCAGRLKPGGLLLYTVEAEPEVQPDRPSAYSLGPGQRYRHDPAALRAWLSGTGFSLLAQDRGTLRWEKGRPVEALVMLAQRDQLALTAFPAASGASTTLDLSPTNGLIHPSLPIRN